VRLLKQKLEALYERYNRREFIHPDPLELVLRYPAPADQELAGLVAATLAYGQVRQILIAVERALAPLGPAPALFLRAAGDGHLRRDYAAFKHRWTTGAELAALLAGARSAATEHGSLGACFQAGYRDEDETVLPALSRFVERLQRGRPGRNSLLTHPGSGSACKRLLLYLRWMVRRDEVDPGVWSGIPAAKLVAPLDTHLFRISRRLRWTRRRQANLRTALEVTARWRVLSPEDPVRYDFALTRPGIRKEADALLFPRRR
jgi:uncharacterized protein (TIGR02757 family)